MNVIQINWILITDIWILYYDKKISKISLQYLTIFVARPSSFMQIHISTDTIHSRERLYKYNGIWIENCFTYYTVNIL